MLSNMTIKMRLIVLVSVLVGVGLAVSVAAFVGFTMLSSAMDDIANRRMHLVHDSLALQFEIADTRAQLLRGTQHDPSNPSSKLHDHPLSRHLDAIAKNKVTIEKLFADIRLTLRSKN